LIAPFSPSERNFHALLLASALLPAARFPASLKVPINETSERILQHPDVRKFLAIYARKEISAKSAVIAIERQWRAEGLDDLEILEGLGKVYGLLSEMVLDAHSRLNELRCISTEEVHPDFYSVYHRTGTLPCMLDAKSLRTDLYKLSTGEKLIPVERADLRSTFSEKRNFSQLDLGPVWKPS